MSIALVAVAQDAGRLEGQVVDQGGGRIPGADVVLRDAGGIENFIKSDGEGNFVVSGLRAGRYIVRVVASGFAPYQNEKVTISAGRRTPLSIMLRVASGTEQITVTANDDSGAYQVNPTLVLRGAALDSLPDSPDGLESALRILAGQSADPNGPEILINGFSGGRLPPKSSIREIRINQDAFSAQYAKPGAGRIEIFTKPGVDTVHGSLYSYFNDESMNSRNPFAPTRPPYQTRLYGGNLSGPIVAKRASFFFDYYQREADENAVITATVLDADLLPVAFNATTLTPQRNRSLSTRMDSQLNPNHTLSGRYAYNSGRSNNAGIGGFSLPSRAYETNSKEHTFQIMETAIGGKAINEVRFKYVRQHRGQFGDNTSPVIQVPEAFVGGGTEIGASTRRQDVWELNNVTIWVVGNHSMRAGAQMHGIRISDFSPRNFAGTFTFGGRVAPQLNAVGEIERDRDGLPILENITTIESYRRTLFLQRFGFNPEEIRARGGEPSEFSIAGGEAGARVNQYDGNIFFQDDWRVVSNLRLSAGIRYEAQTHVTHNLDFAPRLGFSWSPKGPKAKLVFRGGTGIFYDRFNETYTLNARRLGAGGQLQYIVSDPVILNTFPSVPPVETLAAFAVPRAITQIANTVRAPYVVQSSFVAERSLPWNLSLSTTYVKTTALHVIRSRDVNAPLPNGLRPQAGLGDIFQYETSGRFNQARLITSVTQSSNRLTHSLTYVLNKAESDTDGGFPMDSYSLKAEYGRSTQDVRHNIHWGGWMEGPFGLELGPELTWHSGVPFNITTGIDANRDSLYTERPAIAEPGSAGAVATRLGRFNLSPAPGQPVIPRNYGTGPQFVIAHLRVGKTFRLNSENSSGSAPAKRSHTLSVSLQVRNLFNSTNPDVPVGNLSSPQFGRSYSSVGDNGFGGNSGGNRRVEAQVHWSF